MNILPLHDGLQVAASVRRRLSIDRDRAAHLGRSSVEAIRRGTYKGPHGEEVHWRDLVDTAIAKKVSIPPDASLPQPPVRNQKAETTVQVMNETSLAATHALVDAGTDPLVLNFANGIHPGGGFLSGARAQEENLCRSSALYATLEGDPMYEHHKGRTQPDSTDWCILSPDVPVFRTDDGLPLHQPWCTSFITCAAPVATRIGQERSAELLEARIHRVLSVAQSYGFRTLVLGAWGCGAFGNDPHRTAMSFRSALESSFDGVFEHIVFAISDWLNERRMLGPFAQVFS